MLPFTLTLPGTSTIPHPAERALLNLTVSTTGPSKPTVTSSVLDATSTIATHCRSLSPPSSNALAHWSKTSLSASSYIPYSSDIRHERARKYTATVKFDIRFKDFSAMGPFAKKVAGLPCVSISGIDWLLTPGTRRAFQSRLRKEAAADALAKARDYCEVLCAVPAPLPRGFNWIREGEGEVRIRPLELTEGIVDNHGMGVNRMMNARGPQEMQMQMQMQQAPGSAIAPVGGSGGGAGKGAEERDESDLEFRPQEVRMRADVSVKFAVDTLGVPLKTTSEDQWETGTVPAKRRKPSGNDQDEDMEEDLDFETVQGSQINDL
ncbi:MAG: hypothetical protein Q9227_008303 [Pyrenula ochraceoflavens]